MVVDGTGKLRREKGGRHRPCSLPCLGTPPQPHEPLPPALEDFLRALGRMAGDAILQRYQEGEELAATSTRASSGRNRTKRRSHRLSLAQDTDTLIPQNEVVDAGAPSPTADSSCPGVDDDPA